MGQGGSKTSDKSNVENEDCKDCARMKEDIERSMKRKHEKLKRVESEISSLKRLLEDKRIVTVESLKE